MVLGTRLGVRAVVAGVLVLLTLAILPASAQRQGRSGGGTGTTLSGAETEDLLFMREEEKLARDVYLVMYDEWHAQVFSNIWESEQQHMDTLEEKLDKYGVPDPVVDEGVIGNFVNDLLQATFEDLVVRGRESLVEALRVGAYIEELDILDLQHCIDRSTHADLDLAYGALMDGSENHLRAFVSNLAARGIDYTPVLLDQETFDAIIAGL